MGYSKLHGENDIKWLWPRRFWAFAKNCRSLLGNHPLGDSWLVSPLRCFWPWKSLLFIQIRNKDERSMGYFSRIRSMKKPSIYGDSLGMNPVGSPWGAWLFFFSLSKNDDRSLDFICRHARFYLDHKCEINSKRLDPPRSPQGYSLPKRTQGVGPAPWILSHSNFRSGTLILSLEGWAHWILFSSYLRFGTYLIFSKVQPLDFSSDLLGLQFQLLFGESGAEKKRWLKSRRSMVS